MKSELAGNRKLKLLGAIALVVVMVGAVGSLDLMLSAGRHNPSILLVALFVAWVLSPFIALTIANLISKRWSITERVTLYIMTIVLTLGSLFLYGGALAFGTKPAFKYLLVPLLSWILMSIAYFITKFGKKT